jgi:uncharacterized membrane protein
MLKAAMLLTAMLASAAPVTAGEITYYEVTGVAADDVLNIRKSPSAKSDKVGEYSPRDSGIYIVRREGNWALVGRGEAEKPDGWVNTRYLKETVAAKRVILPLICFGTEPFWSIGFESETQALYSDPETPEASYAMNEVSRTGRDAAIRFGGKGRAAISAASCNDGMSDNRFAYSVRVTMPGGRALEGCCRRR